MRRAVVFGLASTALLAGGAAASPAIPFGASFDERAALALVGLGLFFLGGAVFGSLRESEAQSDAPATPATEAHFDAPAILATTEAQSDAPAIKTESDVRWTVLVAQVCVERAARAIEQMAIACSVSPRLVCEIAERFFADRTSDAEEARRRAKGLDVVEESAASTFPPSLTQTMVESIVAAWEAEREMRQKKSEMLALVVQFYVPGHRSRVVRLFTEARRGWCVTRKSLPPLVGFEVLNRDGVWEAVAVFDADFFERIGCATRSEAFRRALAAPCDSATFVGQDVAFDGWWDLVGENGRCSR